MSEKETVERTDARWELVVTSRTMKIWAWSSVAVVMAVHVFMGIVVDVGDTGAQVTPVDVLAFPVLGLIISAACLLMLRPRVRVGAAGVEVRNFLGAHFYPWDVVHGLSFPSDARWARLELPEFEFVPMWALQSRDGAAVVEAVRRFRELEDRYMPED
ncbi:PH domain-containing protein [uncultured Corynebacterium sp.]|uniref:PH domain-containing protein n=1 Tax=uncultured Corynebacterium sp. TaxID=159447 RepID=UPI0025FE73BF|nr:PH domain-containing protein [uncultured Corynebacterium sp.]